MSQILTIEDGGRLTLPADIIDRYGLNSASSVRIIETRTGILIVPLTDEPMGEALEQELEQWQSLGADCLQMFPYDEDRNESLMEVFATNHQPENFQIAS